jgi:hypothetical protein
VALDPGCGVAVPVTRGVAVTVTVAVACGAAPGPRYWSQPLANADPAVIDAATMTDPALIQAIRIWVGSGPCRAVLFEVPDGSLGCLSNGDSPRWPVGICDVPLLPEAKAALLLSLPEITHSTDSGGMVSLIS